MIAGLNVMVTGGCGFVGSHLVDELIVACGIKKIVIVDNLFLHKKGQLLFKWANPIVKFYEVDIRDMPEMEKIFLREEIDVVFNLAVKPLPHSFEDPADNFNNNVGIVMTLLHFLRENYYKRLIHFSSSEVYGSCQVAPMDEGHPQEPSTIYAVSKKTCDDLINCYYNLYQSQSAIIRPFNIYGPRQNKGSYAGVIPRTIERLMTGQPAQIYGDGNQTRDYTYVKDIVRAAILISDQWEHSCGQTFVIASGQETSIDELVNKIVNIYEAITGDQAQEIQSLSRRHGDVRRHIGCGYKIEDILGFKSKISLDSGLIETIKWYISKEVV